VTLFRVATFGSGPGVAILQTLPADRPASSSSRRHRVPKADLENEATWRQYAREHLEDRLLVALGRGGVLACVQVATVGECAVSSRARRLERSVCGLPTCAPALRDFLQVPVRGPSRQLCGNEIRKAKSLQVGSSTSPPAKAVAADTRRDDKWLPSSRRPASGRFEGTADSRAADRSTAGVGNSCH